MKKFLSTLIIGILTISLSACQQTVDEDPQTVIDKAWENLADKNAEYESGTIDAEGKASLEFDNNSGNLEGDLEIKFDSSDPENAKTALKMDISANGDFEGSSGSVDLIAELRTLGKDTYVLLEDLNINSEDPQIDLMANFIGNAYKSQWISVPSDLAGEGADDLFSTDHFKGKQVSEIAKKHNFFEAKEDLGNRKYELSINTEKLKAYLVEVGKITESEIKQSDLEDIDEVLNNLDYTLIVQIDTDYEIEWIKGSVVASDPLEDQQMTFVFEGTLDDDHAEGTLDLSVTGSTPGKLSVEFSADHNSRKVTIETPEDAQEFDLGSLLGGGLGGGLDEPDLDIPLGEDDLGFGTLPQ